MFVIAPPASGQNIPSALGWYDIPGSKIRSVCPSPSSYPQIQGNEGCSAVTADWAGGAFDSKRNSLLIWGGGHSGYAGNEVYALSLDTLSIQLFTSPSTSIRDGCASGGTYSDGKPVARHTYNHLAYLPGPDVMFAWGGSRWQCGGMGGDTWALDLTSLAWTAKSNTNVPTANFGRSAAYDSNTGLVYMRDDFDLRSYSHSSNTWTTRTASGTGQSNGDYKTAVIDPVRKRYLYYIQGDTTLYWYDISSATAPTTLQSGATSGCGFMSSYGAGWEYDPVQDRLVAWTGGNTVYVMNIDSRLCSTVSYSGGPASMANGTFGRFRYSQKYNVFVVCNSVDDDCYTLRLTSGTTSGGSDTTSPSSPTNVSATALSSSQINLTWNASTDNVGVTGYRIYRNGTQITTNGGTSYSDTGLSASTTYTYTIAAYDAAGNISSQSTAGSATTQATSTGATGGTIDANFQSRCNAAGVLTCEGFDLASDLSPAVWPNPGLYAAGDGLYHGTFDTSVKASGNGSLRFEILGGTGANSTGNWRQAFGQSFGAGQKFYVQFRQRFSPEMISLKSNFGGGGWKQVIFHNFSSTCAGLEITTNNGYYRNFPQMYTDCGQGLIEYGNGTDYVLEYSNPYPPGSDGTVYCLHSMVGNPANKCMLYQANQWMTFYYEITIGAWGQPNSTIKAWVGYESAALQQFINKTNHILNQDAPGLGFDYLTLTPYDTGKDGRAHATAYTWYDELIISTQPIAPPSGGSTANPPPAAPTNLQVR